MFGAIEAKINALRRVVGCYLTRKVSEAASYELARKQDEIDFALQCRARDQSAEFIEQTCLSAIQLKTDLDVLKWASDSAQINGLFLEFGVYKGRTINELAKWRSGPIYGFDSFEGLPEDWTPEFRKGHFATLPPPVAPNVTLIKGWFHETLPQFLMQQSEEVALVHIDCDLYSSTLSVLRLLVERIRPGTIIVFDEYFNYPGWQAGEHRALVEWATEWEVSFDYIAYNARGQQMCIKINKLSTTRL